MSIRSNRLIYLITYYFFSERVTGDHLSVTNLNWRNTSFIITRMEAFDQTNGSGAEVNVASGGIDYRFANFEFNARFLGSSVDYIVNIYGEPITTNDVIQGELNERSILVETYEIYAVIIIDLKKILLFCFSLRIFEENTQISNIFWDGQEAITRFEILDQSNFRGGMVAQISGGLSNTFLFVFFETMDNSSTIDFILNVYSEYNNQTSAKPLTMSSDTF